MDVPALLGAQHYELIHWRRPERNVRRFFTIDALVAVCVEHTGGRVGRRHGSAAARRSPSLRWCAGRPCRRLGRPRRVPPASCASCSAIVRSSSRRSSLPVRLCKTTGRSTARPATSTPGFSNMPSWTSGDGGRSPPAGRTSPVTGGRSGHGSLEARHEVLDGGLARRSPTVYAGRPRPSCQMSSTRARELPIAEEPAPTSIGTARTFPTMSPDVWRWRQRGSRPQRLARISLDRSSMSAVRSRPPARARPPRCGPAGSS